MRMGIVRPANERSPRRRPSARAFPTKAGPAQPRAPRQRTRSSCAGGTSLSRPTEGDRLRAVARTRFGENLRQLRLARGHTQENLAERSDLSVDAVRRIEWGSISPSLDTLSKISTGLDISLRTLFSTFGERKRDELAELVDYLSRRSRKETRLVSRLVRALFVD
jgi:transcriptional regulator with XRE-family HTH domain